MLATSLYDCHESISCYASQFRTCELSVPPDPPEDNYSLIEISAVKEKMINEAVMKRKLDFEQLGSIPSSPELSQCWTDIWETIT